MERHWYPVGVAMVLQSRAVVASMAWALDALSTVVVQAVSRGPIVHLWGALWISLPLGSVHLARSRTWSIHVEMHAQSVTLGTCQTKNELAVLRAKGGPSLRWGSIVRSVP